MSSPILSRSRGGVALEVKVDDVRYGTYREQTDAGTLTVSAEDLEHEARLSAYRAELAAFEENRPLDIRWVVGPTVALVVAMVAVMAAAVPGAMTMGAFLLVGMAVAVLLTFADRRMRPVPAPKPPVRRGGAARISPSGIEVRDRSGRWQKAIDAGSVRRVRVDGEANGYAVRVESENRRHLTLLEHLPDQADAIEIAERMEAYLAKLARAPTSGG